MRRVNNSFRELRDFENIKFFKIYENSGSQVQQFQNIWNLAYWNFWSIPYEEQSWRNNYYLFVCGAESL